MNKQNSCVQAAAWGLMLWLLGCLGAAAADDGANLITEDVTRFVSVIAAGEFGDDLETRLRAGYFEAGSPGLAEYSRRFALTPESLAQAMRRYPDYYRSLADIEARIAAQVPRIHQALGRMRDLYDATDLGPVYFVVGALRAGGQNSAVGALIAVETFAADPSVPKHAIPEGHRLFPSSQLPVIIAHEMAHRQQVLAQGLDAYLAIYGERQSILANAIREGTAEFMALLTAGSTTDPESYAFGIGHEAEIWDAFEPEMLNREYGDWFYYKPKARPDWPPDLGYFMGARIVERYYRLAADKQAAMREILGATDPAALLEASGYGTDGLGVDPARPGAGDHRSQGSE